MPVKAAIQGIRNPALARNQINQRAIFYESTTAKERAILVESAPACERAI
jgi:hypothetical protein